MILDRYSFILILKRIKTYCFARAVYPVNQISLYFQYLIKKIRCRHSFCIFIFFV